MVDPQTGQATTANVPPSTLAPKPTEDLTGAAVALAASGIAKTELTVSQDTAPGSVEDSTVSAWPEPGSEMAGVAGAVESPYIEPTLSTNNAWDLSPTETSPSSEAPTVQALAPPVDAQPPEVSPAESSTPSTGM